MELGRRATGVTRSPRHHGARFALALLALVLWVSAANGESGSLFTLPRSTPNGAQKTPNTNGLVLQIDTRWADGYGYRPFKLTVIAGAASAADRTITIECGLGMTLRHSASVVSTQLTLPAGSLSTSKVISAPQFTIFQFICVRTWEEGQLIEGLCEQAINMPSGNYWVYQSPSILFVTPQTLDLTQMEYLFSNPSQGNRYSQSNQPPNMSMAAAIVALHERPAGELVEGWLNYSGLDHLFLSLADARDLSTKRPEVWRAVREWTHSGGTLIVWGLGQNLPALEELEKLLAAQPLPESESKPFRAWEQPRADVFKLRVAPPLDAANNAAALAASEASLDPQIDSTTEATPQGEQPPQATALVPVTAPLGTPFVIRKVVFGQVVALASDQPFPGEERTWRWMFESLDPLVANWITRFGTGPNTANPQFNDFLIADVGLPPIRTYRVLITLFVVGIGPVNYWLLKRSGRLHLFLFTVPLAAILCSALLLGYALVSDGLVSRVRSRSLTQLDQRSGEAASYARMSYYTGLAPSGGMTFPLDAAVMPLELDANNIGREGRSREVVWADEQRLARGWLGARLPTQLVSARVRRTQQQLVALPRAEGAAITVENRLGTTVRALVWCDDTGQLHTADKIEPSARVPLTLLTGAADATPRIINLSKQFGQFAPAFPPDMISAQETRNMLGFRRSRYYYGQQGRYEVAGQSALEAGLTEIRSAVASQTLPQRSYVAIVNRPEEIPLGITGMSEAQSLHVIQGTW